MSQEKGISAAALASAKGSKLWALISIAICIALSAVIQMAANKFFSSYVAGLIFQVAIFVTLSVSLNMINGITGQFSIGHFAFFQIGAYTTGALSKGFYAAFMNSISKTVPSHDVAIVIWLLVMMGAGAIMAAIAGWIVGLPSLRLRGDYLAIVTLGFGEIIRIATENFKYMDGANGTNITPNVTSIWMIWLLAFATIGVSRNLLKSVHGLGFLSIREDEIAATAMGVNVTRLKVTAFILGSAFAGAAGVLYAHQQSFISPDLFTMENSFIVLTMVIFGGTGSITGSALAGAVLFLLPETLRDLPNIPFPVVIAIAFAILITIGSLKSFVDNFHGPKGKKALLGLAICGGGLVFIAIASVLLNLIPAIREHDPIRGANLRLVVFAITLVSLMLFRPQGVFAQHEFSWDWLFGLFRRFRKLSPEAA